MTLHIGHGPSVTPPEDDNLCLRCEERQATVGDECRECANTVWCVDCDAQPAVYEEKLCAKCSSRCTHCHGAFAATPHDPTRAERIMLFDGRTFDGIFHPACCYEAATAIVDHNEHPESILAALAALERWIAVRRADVAPYVHRRSMNVVDAMKPWTEASHG